MLLLLCNNLDSDPDRRGRTSVCRSITPFLDQWINAKFVKSMSASACLPTGRKRRHCTGVSHSVPVRVASRTRA